MHIGIQFTPSSLPHLLPPSFPHPPPPFSKCRSLFTDQWQLEYIPTNTRSFFELYWQIEFFFWHYFLYIGAQILQDPSSVTITDGEWAVFTCAVNCSNGPVAWYLETETERVAINLFIHRDIEGVQYSLSGMDYCNSEEENYTSVLSISGSPRVDRLPLQCSTVCTSSLCSCDQPPNVFNSLIAVLYVKGGLYHNDSLCERVCRKWWHVG